MSIGLRRRIKALLRPKAGKIREPEHCTSRCQDVGNDESEIKAAAEEEKEKEKEEEQEEFVGFSQQHDSAFFRQLPIEIRKMIYSYIWPGKYDYMYHEPNGRHICFKDGHWANMRCVMFEDDEDPDFMQKQMDYIRHYGHGNLLMWQKRLSSTWGGRHWRCTERIEYGQLGTIDRTDFLSLMLVCKRMYPEAVESIFESHKFVFDDLYAAHRFFVRSPSPYLPYLRHLDLTLNMPFQACSPAVINTPNNRVKGVLDSIKLLPRLHDLRVSLDVCDRGPWRKLPERDLVAHLEKCKAFGTFIVELPPLLSIKAHLFDGQELDTSQGTTPFSIVRRPPLRYWQFDYDEVEHFTWETFQRDEQPHCQITLAKSGLVISNPYLPSCAC